MTILRQAQLPADGSSCEWHGAMDDRSRLVESLRTLAGPELDELLGLIESARPAAEEPPSDAGGDDAGAALVFSLHTLQAEADYRGALQSGFHRLRSGGRLVVAVPRGVPEPAEPTPAASPTLARCRRYSCKSLLSEVEEALEPGSYRVRLLWEHQGPPGGPGTEIILVLERVGRPPAPSQPAAPRSKLPDRDFGERRTRIEAARVQPTERVLILKLDHLGDFVMSLPALRKAREAFAHARLTLMVASWNAGLARERGLADEIIVFDAFPRNSSEEKVELEGRTALFRQAVPGSYDLAIDLRTDPDTRFYLDHVNATVRAGLGTRARFPFLDIFLPIDLSRHEPEMAREDIIDLGRFAAQRFCTRNRFRIHCAASDVTSRFGSVIWGPYEKLRPGRYFFEPFIEFDEPGEGMLLVDIAFDCERHLARAITSKSKLRLDFFVDKPDTLFEFRVEEPENAAPAGFSFYGGRLVREGGDSVLHQAEYQMLLIELITLRMQHQGLLTQVGAAE